MKITEKIQLLTHLMLLPALLCAETTISEILDDLGTQKTTFMAPMSDSTRLATDVYFPIIGETPYPSILVRTPYGRILGEAEDMVATLLSIVLEGYALVIQDSRGRGESEGIDSVYFSDGWGKRRDGYDTVEWIAAQSWSNGKVGMWGPSALGISGLLAAGAGPPHLTCVCAIVASGNLYEHALFYHGAYRHALSDGWLRSVGRDSISAYFTEHANYDHGYDRVNLSTRYDSVSVPMLHVGGWHDIFTQGTIDAFLGLQHQGGPGARGKQKMIIGPWEHDLTDGTIGDLAFPGASPLLFVQQMVDWFDYWMKNKTGVYETIPTVQYYMMGDADQWDGPGNRWVDSEDWPPNFEPVPFFLHADSSLSRVLPSPLESPDVFTYDPNNPVPTLGGRNLNIPAGSVDQRAVESRPDVLVYTTELLTDTIEIAGPVSVTLYAATDAVDTDFTAKLCDVYPDGRSMLIADGIVRARKRNSIWFEEFLTPNAVTGYDIDLWATAVTFAPGHRIRLSISSSNYPRFDINPNTGEPFRRHTDLKPAIQTVYHETEYPSALILPVISGVDTKVQSPQQVAVGPDTPTLSPNYPNPFNSSTFIPVHGLENNSSDWILQIVNVQGQIIRTLDVKQSGAQRWDGRDDNNRMLPSGIYFVRLSGKKLVKSLKITLLK